MDSLSKRLKIREDSISFPLIFSQSLSSIAPLGSVAAYLTFALEEAGPLTPLAAVLGVALYALWVYIAYGYSSVVESEGGTYQFALVSLPKTLAVITGWLYWGSYVLFILSTTSYVLGVVLPLVTSTAWVYKSLETAVPILVLLVVFSGVKPPLYYTLFTSVLETAVIYLLGFLVLSKTGLPNLHAQVSLPSLASGALAVSYTVAGGGASFFFGREASGGGSSVSKAYLLAFCLASASVVLASLYEVSAGGGNLVRLVSSGFPGLVIAREYGGWNFGVLVTLLTVNSLVGSVIAAYSAVSRLTSSLVKTELHKSVLLIAVIYATYTAVGVSAGNLVELYQILTAGSLFCLFLSHGILSLGFPSFSKRRGKATRLGLTIGILSFATMIITLVFTALSLGTLSLAGLLTVSILASVGAVRARSNMS